MDYDTATIRWAAKRLKTPARDIDSVDFDAQYVEGCPTCGGDIEMRAYVTMRKGSGRNNQRIEFTDFQEVIREILVEL